MPKKTARKTQYETVVAPVLHKIRKWMKSGADLTEVANKLKIPVSTLKRYVKLGEEGDERYTELYEISCEATQENGEEVEAALFRSATGYNAKIKKHYKLKRVIFDEVTGRRISEEEYLEEAEEEVHVPANVSAQMFWLANRIPERWKYKPDGDGEDKGGAGIIEIPAVDMGNTAGDS